MTGLTLALRPLRTLSLFFEHLYELYLMATLSSAEYSKLIFQREVDAFWERLLNTPTRTYPRFSQPSPTIAGSSRSDGGWAIFYVCVATAAVVAISAGTFLALRLERNTHACLSGSFHRRVTGTPVTSREEATQHSNILFPRLLQGYIQDCTADFILDPDASFAPAIDPTALSEVISLCFPSILFDCVDVYTEHTPVSINCSIFLTVEEVTVLLYVEIVSKYTADVHARLYIDGDWVGLRLARTRLLPFDDEVSMTESPPTTASFPDSEWFDDSSDFNEYDYDGSDTSFTEDEDCEKKEGGGPGYLDETMTQVLFANELSTKYPPLISLPAEGTFVNASECIEEVTLDESHSLDEMISYLATATELNEHWIPLIPLPEDDDWEFRPFQEMRNGKAVPVPCSPSRPEPPHPHVTPASCRQDSVGSKVGGWFCEANKSKLQGRETTEIDGLTSLFASLSLKSLVDTTETEDAIVCNMSFAKLYHDL